ncbi:uncharacterized protein bmm isoform X2 [Periplaneta americana]|uniref:uncharacterized protein bmm isoform X2 n=1 Tax=Periplaneta americana TaxID=6978 RepID=UPI0037E97BF7
MNLSFAGCGFLGIYHVGVAGCFKKYAPHLVLDKVSGASAGAIAACSLLCDLPLDMISNVLRVVSEARQGTLGPFSPSFNIHKVLLEGLEKALPDDAHLRVTGKLHISLTRVYDGKNVIVSQFNSKEDLVQALLASSFIPVFSGLLPPKFHGVRYMDGGLSDNLPMLDENTITVSPFCGESDICPRDLSSQLFHINVSNTSIELSKHNIYRFARILFPPKPEILSNMCKQGFDDALMFLHRNNLINCTRCLAIQSTYVVSDTQDESFDFDPECQECKLYRQESLVSSIPDTIITLFEEAIESANKGLVNWIFKHRGMKLLSVLSLPYTLPADIVYATFTNYVGNTVQSHSYEFRVVGNVALKRLNSGAGSTVVPLHTHKHKRRFLASAPSLGNNLRMLSQYLMNQLSALLDKVNNKDQKPGPTVRCHLAITEFGGTKYDVDNIQDVPVAVKNKMNINFTLNESRPPSVVGQADSTDVRLLSRRSSFAVSCTDLVSTPVEDDTFEHILQETAHHDTVMAYYYMDENHKVKVTEIVDVTDADTSAILTPEEQANNIQLEFDDEWNEHPTAWLSQQTLHEEDDPYYEDDLGLSDISVDDYNADDHGDSRIIFSDPESEWNNPATVEKLSMEKLNSMEEAFSLPPNSLPESDQRTGREDSDQQLSRKPSYVIMSNLV